MTRLSVQGMAFGIGLLWGGAILFVGLFNLGYPSYGVSFLQMAGSIYPGFRATGTFVDVLVGTGYGLVDGAVGGVLLAWLYNSFGNSSA